MKIIINTAQLRFGVRGMRFVKIFASFFVFVWLVFGVYAYIQWQHTQELLKDPDRREQAEFKATIAEIGRLILLPKDEIPTLATVSESDRLRNMTFFKHA